MPNKTTSPKPKDSADCSAGEGRSAPPCYALIYMALVPVARGHGYALAVHGSMSRDCDLVAIPWTDKASHPEPMIEALKAAAEGVWVHHDWDQYRPTASNATEKPHGRKAYSIHLTNNGCNGPYLDISVMPLLQHNSVLGGIPYLRGNYGIP